MTIKRRLSDGPMFELKDHRDNTAGTMLKCYSPAQLSFMDGVDQAVISHSKKYLPVRVDSGPAMDRFRRGLQEKPYRIMYVRLDEIRALYHKRTGNKLEIELKK